MNCNDCLFQRVDGRCGLSSCPYQRVYCTDCRHFYCEDETPKCPYSDMCDLDNPEDSEFIMKRPYYNELIF